MFPSKRFQFWDEKSFQLAYVYWQLGMLLPEDVPRVACQALQSGLDGEVVRLVAGLHEPTSRDIEDTVDLAQFWRQLGLQPLDAHEAADWIAVRCCKQILEGQITPIDGTNELWDLYVNLGYPNEIKWSKLACLSDEYCWDDNLTDTRRRKIDKRARTMAVEVLKVARGS
jgi:hypothetical protein